MKHIVQEAGKMPRFYGIAYRDYVECQTICYPVPINLIIRLWRYCCWQLARCPYLVIDRRINEARYYYESMREVAGYWRKLTDPNCTKEIRGLYTRCIDAILKKEEWK